MSASVAKIPQSSQTLVTNAVNQWNANNPNAIPIDINAMLSIVAVESEGNLNAINHNSNGTTDNGIMQLNSAYFPTNLTPAANVATGVAYYGGLVQQAGGNNANAVSAYNTGSVNKYSDTYVNAVNAAGNGISGAGGIGSSINGSAVQGIGTGVTPGAASAYTPLNNNSGNVDLSQIVSPIVILEGLNATPWYTDPGLLTGNVRLRNDVQPVSFQVMLHDSSDFILSSGGETGAPIQVQLNASMKTVNWSMKHLYHHQRTRTAHHITMWGMNADTIEGTCTTGVFMNQFGLTDYYSTRTVNDKLKTLVTSGEMFVNGNTANLKPISSSGLGGTSTPNLSVFNNGSTTVNGPNGQSITTAAGNNSNTNGFINSGDAGFSSIMQNAAKNNSHFTQTDAFRVAAQDAFMEFLALFKMNGSVWFWNKTYQDNTGESRDWEGIQAWSPTLGLSSAQKNSRNNDVLTRGGVIMSYRNFAYQGYFKTLQWTMDARNPFQWNFSFTFQVEKTVGQQFLPMGN